MSTDTKHPDFCRRRALKVAVGAICTETGFSHAEESCLETLCEMLQSYVTEVGRSAQGYCELAGRTEPLVSDVSLALVEMGSDIDAVQPYSKRPNKTMFMPPLPANNPNQPKTLQAGEKKSLPPHIPDYFPSFPDPHTYIHTQTHKPPATEYQLIREKAATQKRDVECALTKFIAKTGDTESLFSDDPYAFPLIANKPHSLPYIDALLLKEEDLDGQEQDEDQAKPQQQPQPQKENDKKEEQQTPSQQQQQQPNQQQQQQQQNQPQQQTQQGQQQQQQQQQQQSQQQGDGQTAQPGNTAGTPNKPGDANQQQQQQEALDTSDGQIDNPYLREIKMPKLKGGGRKSYASFKW